LSNSERKEALLREYTREGQEEEKMRKMMKMRIPRVKYQERT